MKAISKTILSAVGIAVVAFASSGCATTVPYINKDLPEPLELSDTAFHQFSSVTAYEDGGEVVLYGKARHSHSYCKTEGHVDIASVDEQGQVIYTASLPLKGSSSRKGGWYRADFRTRIDGKALRGTTVRLAFHDADCVSGFAFDCGENQAGEASAPE